MLFRSTALWGGGFAYLIDKKGLETGTQLESIPSREGATGGLDRASGFPSPLENSVRRVFPNTASNGPSAATFDDVPGLSAVHIRLMTPPYTRPQLSLPGIRDPRRDYPFENLSVQCGTTPSNFHTSIQRPLARQRVFLSAEPGIRYSPSRVHSP